ncbi:MAG: hypothetical protein Q8L47_04390 [bacterium]|nr:hypothetical protein [bacterium]
MPYKNRDDLYRAQKKHRIKVRINLLEFLSNKYCKDCGENDPIVLDFDHKDPDIKFKPISNMLSGHYSWKSVKSEIEKCDVRCANCHRRKTHIQFKYYGKSKSP